MNDFDLRKYLAENKLLKEELVYQFSEYDYDITEEEGYQEDVITRIKEELPTVDHEEIMKMIRSIEDYYYDEAREENKRGEEYPSVSSEDFAGEVIWNLEELGLAENKLLNEEITLNFYDEDAVTLIDDSGEYDGDIEGDGMVSFSLVDDEEEFEDYNWEDILGSDHAFVKINKQIPTKVEASGDYVMITVNIDDLKGISNVVEGRLLKEEISITGDYMGEPEIYSGHNFGKFLKEMLELALNEDDFVNKVIMGVTDETSNISLEDEMKIRSYYMVYKK